MATNFPDTSVDNTFVTPNRPWADGDEFDDTANSGLIYYWYDPVWKTNAGDSSSVPDLQAVTDVGYTTDNPIRVGDGSVTGGMLLNNGGTAGNSYFEVYGNSNTNDTQTAIYVRQEKDVGDHTIELKYDGSGEFAGDVQMASQNAGPLAGFRNQIINGNFEIAQRGYTGSSGSGIDREYGGDRWVIRNISPADYQWEIADGFTGADPRPLASIVDNDHSNALRFNFPLAVTETWGFSQKFENSTVCGWNGKTLTISFASSIDHTDWVVYVQSAGDPAVSFTLDSTTVNPYGSTGFFITGSANIPADTFNRSSNITTVFLYNTREMNAGDSVEVGKLQLEPGPVATPFEHRPIGTELALCQRYYQKLDRFRLYVVAPEISLRYLDIPRPVVMRVSPTEETGTVNSTTVTFSGTAENISVTSGSVIPSVGVTVSDYTADAEL